MRKFCIIKVILSITLTFTLIPTIMISNIDNVDSTTIAATHIALAQHINAFQGNNGPNLKSGIKGTVYLNGPECPPTVAKGVALCNGPYSAYQVTIYAEDGNTIVSTVKTDTMGNYIVPLSPGHYIIYTQVGPLKSQSEANHVIVKENQISQKNLYIDTGIR
jgi:hypothetical protein